MRELNELIEFLSKIIIKAEYILRDSHGAVIFISKDQVAMLKEIKKKLEQKNSYSDGYMQGKIDADRLWVESRIPPDDDLVEKVLQIGVDYWHNVGKFAPGQPHKIESDEAKAEIRKLLLELKNK